jgi:hypothetical protein
MAVEIFLFRMENPVPDVIIYQWMNKTWDLLFKMLKNCIKGFWRDRQVEKITGCSGH